MFVNCQPCDLTGEPAAISFTFDDVFASAIDEGGAQLEARGLRGTYYVAGALMGRSNRGMPFFTRPQLEQLARQGHEIGCHTFNHVDIAGLDGAALVRQWDLNQAFVREHTGVETMASFSYPFGSHMLLANRLAAQRFQSTRDVRDGVNKGRVDLSKLKAISLDRDPDSIHNALAAIDRVRRSGGWLILMTHDVDPSPQEYGVHPQSFQAVIDAAVATAVPVMTVRDATAVFTRDT